MRSFNKKAHCSINKITLLVILLVLIEGALGQNAGDKSIHDNQRLVRPQTRGRVLRAFVRPGNLSTAPYYGKRRDNLVVLRDIHMERQSRRYQLHWFLELAQKYSRIARKYEQTLLSGNNHGNLSTRHWFTSFKVL